jgi:nitrous oxidase accessory protein
VIEIAAGTFALAAPLEPKAGMTLTGAGIGQTIITHEFAWKPSTATLPDPEVTTKGMDTRACLFRLQDKAGNISLSGMTLRGPHLHNAIFGYQNKNLHLHHLRIEDFLASGIRTFLMAGAKIHDCEFVDAGGRWKRGVPGNQGGNGGGISGGSIFAVWFSDSEIYNNRFTRTKQAMAHEVYGIKARQGKRCRIHHNTIELNFSIEFPHENDQDVEIDHNVLHGTVSLPKDGGGALGASKKSFHIHHNWFQDSYAIEFARNGAEIDHNLFDFDLEKDHGNLISGFNNQKSPGPASFHNNLVSNPGRGVIWINDPFNNIEVRNNHIITRTTATPRTEGLFGFNKQSELATLSIRNNIIECIGQARPLLRFKEATAVQVENNQLTNVLDQALYSNPKTQSPMGLEAPLTFTCGMHDEMTVNGWKVTPTKAK